MLDTIITVFLVCMHNNFSIAVCSKVVAMYLQFLLKLIIVVNFSIEDDEDALIFVKNGLMPACYVDNGETAHAERDSIAYPNSLIVWSTVPNNLAHASNKPFCVISVALYVNKSCDSTH